MTIGIIGPAQQAAAWENHLAGHSSISEVIVASHLKKVGSVDVCLLLNKSLNQTITAVKQGIHTFLVSKLPVEAPNIEKLYYASQEANVRLQFSHWPTLAPASQWAALKIPDPSFIQVVRTINHSTFLENDTSHRALLIDEIAYCLKYIKSSVHQVYFNTNALPDTPSVSHLMLQFDNSATANIFINTAAQDTKHTRFISDANFIIECNADAQRTRTGRKTENGHLFFDRKEFDPTKAAEQSVTKFLKAIQLKKPTLYNGYDLLQLSKILEKIQF